MPNGFCREVKKALRDEDRAVTYYARLAKRCRVEGGGEDCTKLNMVSEEEGKHYDILRLIDARVCRRP